MFKPYSYHKDENWYRQNNSFSSNSLKPLRPVTIAKGLVSSVLIGIGAFVLTTRVIMPAMTIYAETEQTAPIISPMPDNTSADLAADFGEEFSFDELSPGFKRSVDFVEENGILVQAEEPSKKTEAKDLPEYFYLTIPKLKIEKAKIETNSTNLDPKHALGHYKGTCLPDEACNTFIFGHSTYRNAPDHYKDGDYTAIFSELDELEYGDEFYIDYNGQEYKYIVDLAMVQRPENIDPLEQPYPGSLVKHQNTVELFTCTPPGTTKYRLSVIGKQVK